jgi:hypothetical protein
VPPSDGAVLTRLSRSASSYEGAYSTIAIVRQCWSLQRIAQPWGFITAALQGDGGGVVRAWLASTAVPKM